MEELGPVPRMPEITEENLAESQARVRAELVRRYELMWTVVEARIKDDKDEIRPLDPRLLEIGRGVLREVSLLYRLAKPPVQAEAEEDQILPLEARRELVAASLDELEAKRKAQAETAAARQAAKEQAQGQAAS
jgi:hypothetical protein